MALVPGFSTYNGFTILPRISINAAAGLLLQKITAFKSVFFGFAFKDFSLNRNSSQHGV